MKEKPLTTKEVMDYTPEPDSFKMTQPKTMTDKEKGFWLGVIVGIVASNIVLVIIFL